MRSKSRTYFFCLFIFGFFAAASIARADPPVQVGRISYIEGNVSFRTNSFRTDTAAPPSDSDTAPADDAKGQWVPAQLNYPVTAGDALWADINSRLEVQIGATDVRADRDSEIDVVRLDSEMTTLRVDQGIVNVNLETLDGPRFSVLTPQGQIDFVKPGSYHIEVASSDDDGSNNREEAPEVIVTTLEGQAHIDTARAALDILPGESAIVNGDPVNVTLTEGNATDFDNWALVRERREHEAITTRYVSPEMTGHEDLDSAGRWDSDPEYGTVWYPAVPMGWAPYRYGHWAYVDPWGWTWIDDAPWGFAPFHYGRWVYVHHAWGWCPGARVVRPVYAPALVAFVGGNGWRVAVNAGAHPIGWVPLAPHEVYRPYYPASANYIRNINSNHVDKTVINNIVVNNNERNETRDMHFHNRDAMTVVTSETFSHARPIRGQTLPVSHDEVTHAAPLTTPNQIRPVRSSDGTWHRATSIPHVSELPSNHAVNIRPENNRPTNNPPINNFPTNTPPINRVPAMGTQPEPSNASERIPRAVESRPVPRENSNQLREPPVVRMPPPRTHWASRAVPQQPQEPPPHPMQHTEIHPTPQGWQRAPAPANSHPASQQEHRSAPPQQHERRNEHQ